MKIGHVNVYLFAGSNGWTVIDAGYGFQPATDAWTALLAGPLQGFKFERLMVTHAHADHIGAAGWLARTLDVPIMMSEAEHEIAQRDLAQSRRFFEPEHRKLLADLGLSEKVQAAIATHVSIYPPGLTGLPMEYEKVSNGDILEIGGRRLKVLLGPGHSAAQIMLRSEEENFLMSVDQVLGNAFSLLIPPVDDPMRDVYTEFMASLDELERITDPETLVIAGHYTPFNRALGRIDATRDYHRGREEMVLNACAERPRTIEELAVIVYIKKMTDRQLQHAVFDVLAYVNRLVATHRLTWLPQKGATRLIALA